MKLARDAGMDLVEVAPTERPPVCRIMDYGKWKYTQKKKKQKGKHGHEVQIKEVRIRPKTDPHDKMIKVNRAMKFLDDGDKVQFTMIFRGRERAHANLGMVILETIAADLEDRAKMERPPRLEGRRMTMLLTPTKVPSKPRTKPPAKARTKPPVSSPSAPAPVSPPAPPAVEAPAPVQAPAEAPVEAKLEAPVQLPAEAPVQAKADE